MAGAGSEHRSAERRTVAGFLASAAGGPSALLIEGEPGIGKTTLWSAVIGQAEALGFRVLTTRAAAVESVLAYTALADLLDVVEAGAWADLPAPQLAAVDQVLLRTDNPAVTDQRAVAAAFLSVIERLTDDGPVLLAIDDLQWVDPSSMHVLAFAARRLTGPVSIVASVRTEVGEGASATGLQMPRPEAVTRIRLKPLSLRELHAAVSSQLRRPFSRPTIGRIHQLSGGNPFYAMELARAIDERALGVETPLPRTLTDVVRTRIGNLDPEVHDALLAASSMAAPTVELVSRATLTDGDRLLDQLEIAETRRIIVIDGNRIRFAHPLLARGVYTEAAPSRRRLMHRRLADIVEEPELRARHLALAATSGDHVTLRALDTAADSAQRRGAPAAAAELIDLAINLGGDTPERRLRSALHHFDAGAQERAVTILEETIDQLPAGNLRAEALTRLAVVRLYGEGFHEVDRMLEQALREAEDNSPLRVQVSVSLAYVLLNANQLEDSVRMADSAVTDAERLGQPHLLSLALGMRTILQFLSGNGLDDVSIHRALALEDPQAYTPLVFRPTVQHALLLEWTGQLERADEVLDAIRARCMERGEEGEEVFIAQHVVMSSIWRGDFVKANLIAEDAMGQARHLGGNTPLYFASCLRALLAAHSGHEADARQAINEAFEIGRRLGSARLLERVHAALTFLELSLGNYEAAVGAARPLVAAFDAATTPTELPNGAYLPDAIEALVTVGRADDAEPLVQALERNGRRLDRAWMRAAGARTRAMLCAARGNLDEAHAAALDAMADYNKITMPFERARTLLLLGQVERRQRKKESASSRLQEAGDLFEQMNVPLWADRARAELQRANVGPRQSGELTPSEQRVAELAASGLRNRDVAETLFISPKTVEANLARIYRKLGIKSRAELGRHIGGADGPQV